MADEVRRDRPTRPETQQDRREARSAPVERELRKRARHVRRMAQRLAHVAHEAGFVEGDLMEIEPPVDVVGAVRGDISRSAISRAPPPHTVLSIAFSSELFLSPESVRTSSRLARVAGSMKMVEAVLSRSGAPSAGRSANWVFLTGPHPSAGRRRTRRR